MSMTESSTDKENCLSHCLRSRSQYIVQNNLNVLCPTAPLCYHYSVKTLIKITKSFKNRPTTCETVLCCSVISYTIERKTVNKIKQEKFRVWFYYSSNNEQANISSAGQCSFFVLISCEIIKLIIFLAVIFKSLNALQRNRFIYYVNKSKIEKPPTF